MKKYFSLLFLIVVIPVIAPPVVAALNSADCGNLDIDLAIAMKSCNPNAEPFIEAYGIEIAPEEWIRWLTATESHALLSEENVRHDWIILDVRFVDEYVGDISPVAYQGHPMFLKKDAKNGEGRGNYEHAYLNEWYVGPGAPNLDFWARIQELESAGIIQKDRTNIIVMCRTGWRGHGAANFLAMQGFVAYNMGNETFSGDSGFLSWYASGLPTTCNDGDDNCVIAPQFSGFNLNDLPPE